MAILSFFRIFSVIYLLDSIVLKSYGYHDKCSFVTEKEPFLIGEDTDPGVLPYNEIHIRHNLKGGVEIKDSPLDMDQKHITVEIEKQASDRSQLNSIVVKQYVFDTGGVKHFIVQLDYDEQGTSMFVVVAGVLGIVILLAVIMVMIYIYHKKHRDQTPRIIQTTSYQNRQSVDNESTSGPTDPNLETKSSSMSLRQRSAMPLTPPPPAAPLHDPYDRYTSRTSTPTHHSTDRYHSDLPPPPTQHELDYGTAGHYTLPNKSTYRIDTNTLPRQGDYTMPRSQRSREAAMRNRDQALDSSDSSYSSPQSTKRGVGTPRGLHRSTLLSVTIFGTLACVVYASCISEPRVKVFLFVPAGLRLGAIKIFGNTEYYIPVETHEWIHKNNTRLQIYDIVNAGDLKEKTCAVDKWCQERAMCEPTSQECVCQRGYSIDESRDNRCTDINECVSRPGVCPGQSICQNTDGSYICHCGMDYYHQNGKCKVCSQGCPEGEFEMMPCTYEADRICSGSICLYLGTSDAAHPVLISENDTRAGYLEGLKAESSENVFMENLHNTKQLETMNYIMDNMQESDFLWYRDSGIRVNIGIRDVMIIPEYTDASYKSDNGFVLNNPSMVEEKDDFSSIIDGFCRHPIPESYMITLEVYRDRTTAATKGVCGKRDPSCPSGLQYGDEYINRTLDEACDQMGTYPDKLKPAANSIVCTEATVLLKDIFNRTAPPVRPITFPSRQCKQARTKCDQCISQSNCHMLDALQERCCEVDCYIYPECKKAASDECIDFPVQCAMGDSYRYTIQPVFKGIRHEFTCHLQHKKPRIFYKLWFYVSVIGTNFETPKIYTEVTSDDIGDLSIGSYIKAFFTIEHNAGIELQEDMILHGKEAHAIWKYNLYNKKRPDEYERKKFGLVNIGDNTLMAPVQFNEPFAYSSTTWVNGNNCDKNTSYFRSLQNHYHETGGQEVAVSIQTTDSPYKYTLRSPEIRPHMKFIIPSNVSVLDWWFKDQKVSLHIDDSLQASLSLSSDSRIWTIFIRGNMTDCPGYVNVIINDRLELEELFRYDLLVSCPTSFNVTFKVPNRGQKKDKTFDIVLNDTHKEHTLFLTYLGPVEERHWYNYDESDAEYMTSQKANWSTFVVVVITLFIFIITLVIIHVYLECCKISARSNNGKFDFVDRTTEKSANIGQNSRPCGGPSQMTCFQFAYLTVYLAFKLIYSLCFTFTIFYTIVLIVCKADLYKISTLGSVSESVNNISINVSHEIENFSKKELSRQIALFEHTLSACDLYTEDIIASVVSQMRNITTDSNVEMMHKGQTSIGNLLSYRHHQLLTKYQDQIKTFEEDTMKGFHDNEILPSVSLFNKFLKDINKNDWLSHVKKLYNESKRIHMLPFHKFNTVLEGDSLEFSKYLEIESVQEVEFMLLNFWESYHLQLPDLPSLKMPLSNFTKCKLNQSDRKHTDKYLNGLLNITANFTKYELMNTTRHAQQMSGDHLPPSYNRRLELRHHQFNSYIEHLQDELKVQLFSRIKSKIEPVEFKSILEDFDFSYFKLIFLCLDILLILYRFSHMYMNAKNLCHGFEDNVYIKDVQSYIFASELDKSYEVQLACSSDRSLQRVENEYSSTHIPTLERQKDGKNHVKKPKQPNGNILNESTTGTGGPGEYLLHKNTQIKLKSQRNCSSRVTDTWDYYTNKLLHTCLVSKCVIIYVIIFIMYIMLICVSELSSESMLLTLGAIFPVFSKLRTQAYFSNWHLDIQAEQSSQSLLFFYSKLSHSVLQELYGLVQYFNSEQTRITSNYMNESCAINASYTSVNMTTCDGTNVLPTIIDTHILPCDTVPIQPLHYQYNASYLEDSFETVMAPFLLSTQHVITAVIYIVLCVGGVIIVIHVTGCLIFHFFKTQRIFPVRVVYILPSVKKYIQTLENVTDNPGVINQEPQIIDPSETLTTLMSSTSTLGSKIKQVKFSPIRSTVTVPRTDTVTSDLGYSETKV